MTIDELAKKLKEDHQAFCEFVSDSYGKKAIDAMAHYRVVLKIFEDEYTEDTGIVLWRLSVQDTKKYFIVMTELQEQARLNVIQVYKQYSR